MSDCTKEIQTIFSDVLMRKVPSATADLLETGILDSMALVDLLASLEDRFGLSINVLDLDLENFRSIQTIERFVSSSQKPAGKN